jgi:hypothetical protein
MMTKTVKEYMNDPRILDDPDMQDVPECIREIHAIRLKHQDETAGMTPEEHADYVNKKAAAFLARSGIKPHYADFTEQGRVSQPMAVSIAQKI